MKKLYPQDAGGKNSKTTTARTFIGEVVAALESRKLLWRAEIEILLLRKNAPADESTGFREQLIRTVYHPHHRIDAAFLQKQRRKIFDECEKSEGKPATERFRRQPKISAAPVQDTESLHGDAVVDIV